MTDKERQHMLSKRAFVILDGKVVWKDNSGDHSVLTTMEWVTGPLGVPADRAEELVRGSIMKDHVVICHGSAYDKVNMDILNSEHLVEIVREACEFAGTTEIRIYNGCVVGEPGEDWPPIQDLGLFKSPDMA